MTTPGPPNEPGGAPPAKPSLWDRYRHSPMWLRVGLPAAIVIIVIVIIAIAVNASDSDSDSADGTTTTAASGSSVARDVFLLSIARSVAEETIVVPDTTTTTEAVTTTTEAATTTTATTLAGSTTLPVAPTTTPTTTPPTTTTAATTTTTEPTTTTTAKSTTTTSLVPLPPGQISADAAAFQQSWNTAAKNSGTDVPAVTSWTQKQLDGETTSSADLGGNIRLVLLSETPTSPIAQAVLVWRPLDDDDNEGAQNLLYRNAFSVLMKTVNPDVTTLQQSGTAGELGLSGSQPPFPEGPTVTADLAPNQYQRRAVVPAGQTGVYTLVAATELT